MVEKQLLALVLLVPMSTRVGCSSFECREACEQSSEVLAECYRGCLWLSKLGKPSGLNRYLTIDV